MLLRSISFGDLMPLNAAIGLRQRIERVGLFTVIVVGFLVCMTISGCYANLSANQKGALDLANAMHDRMRQGDLAGIYANADQRYRSAMSREKSDALFSAIARKLGSPQNCNQQSSNLQVATWGTTLRTICQTTFTKNATGSETFVWIKTDNQFRLLSYTINSDQLIVR
jgi:hypothetical protein